MFVERLRRTATQDLSDFFGLDDGKYGRAIINNSQNKIILNLEPDEAKYVQDILSIRIICDFGNAPYCDSHFTMCISSCKSMFSPPLLSLFIRFHRPHFVFSVSQRTIMAVWVLLKFIELVDPMAHYSAVYPSQLFFLKENNGYEIVVLYEGEENLLRLLQPSEDLKYIIVLPVISMVGFLSAFIALTLYFLFLAE